MPTKREYVDYIIETAGSADVRARAMMGEFLLYYKDKLVGGVYDGMLLVKPVAAAEKLLSGAVHTEPYSGAKSKMIAVENVDDGEFLIRLFEAVYDELPAPKRK